MAVDVEAAAAFLGISEDEPLLAALVDVADSLVTGYLRPSGDDRIPETIRDHAVLTLVSELWQRRNAPAGVASWSADGSTPVRLARDVLMVVRPLLNPYRGVGSVG